MSQLPHDQFDEMVLRLQRLVGRAVWVAVLGLVVCMALYWLVTGLACLAR